MDAAQLCSIKRFFETPHSCERSCGPDKKIEAATRAASIFIYNYDYFRW